MSEYSSWMKTSLARIVQGFFIGIGFAAALWIISFYMINKAEKTFDDKMNFSPERDFSKLEVLDHRDISTDEKIIILGTIVNNDSKSWHGIQLEAEFFNGNEFVYECSEYISNNMEPAKIENYKISCGGCPGDTLPIYDSYTIEIKSAYD